LDSKPIQTIIKGFRQNEQIPEDIRGFTVQFNLVDIT